MNNFTDFNKIPQKYTNNVHIQLIHFWGELDSGWLLPVIPNTKYKNINTVCISVNFTDADFKFSFVVAESHLQNIL